MCYIITGAVGELNKIDDTECGETSNEFSVTGVTLLKPNGTIISAKIVLNLFRFAEAVCRAVVVNEEFVKMNKRKTNQSPLGRCGRLRFRNKTALLLFLVTLGGRLFTQNEKRKFFACLSVIIIPDSATVV